MEKTKLIAVVGPTASGKTELGVKICKKFNGEVISSDSMQIYKGMNIATAKPTAEEMQGIKHYLIDYISPQQEYSVASFVKDAKGAVEEIVSKGKLPVVVGGTGLYTDSFIENITFFDEPSSKEIRNKLFLREKNEGIEGLYAELKQIDPVSASNIHINNKVKIIRALEVYYTTGMTITKQNEQSKNTPSDYEPLYIGITYKNRDLLYERINRRVDLMLQKGLLAEAEMFYSAGFSDTSVNAIGYKELKPYLDGTEALDVCIENLKRSTRHYAKRQLTWFNRNKNVNWIYPDTFEAKEAMFEYVFSLIDEFLRK